jgi:hypothetical protein
MRPVKKKPKQTKIVKKKQRIPEDVIKQQLEIFEQATNARYRIARLAYEAQDSETRRILDMVCDRLKTAGSGYIRIFPNGKRNPSVAIPINLEFQDKNILFIATEILKDLALFDVKVANYKFPKVYCVNCGDRLRGGD